VPFLLMPSTYRTDTTSCDNTMDRHTSLQVRNGTSVVSRALRVRIPILLRSHGPCTDRAATATFCSITCTWAGTECSKDAVALFTTQLANRLKKCLETDHCLKVKPRRWLSYSGVRSVVGRSWVWPWLLHTKDVVKMVPDASLLSAQHIKDRSVSPFQTSSKRDGFHPEWAVKSD